MKPLVSILIPAYNAGAWIADTLRSAIEQTWEPKEIIVVDDGSTDETLQIARQFESESVRILTQANQGAAVARNLAFQSSKGDYIQWLDADDLLAPDKIEKQMAAIGPQTTKRTLLSSEWGQFLFRHTHAEFTATSLWQDLTPREWLLRKLGENVYMQTGVWLISRELAEATGPWDKNLRVDDDGEYVCRMLLQTDSVQFVPGSKVLYRVSSNSLSYIGFSDRKIEAQWLSMKRHIACLRSMEDSDRVRNACLNYLHASLIYFYPERQGILTEMEALAKDLGGVLHPPRLSWKYAWIQGAFGWPLAKRAQRLLPRIRWAAHRSLDRALHSLGR